MALKKRASYGLLSVMMLLAFFGYGLAADQIVINGGVGSLSIRQGERLTLEASGVEAGNYTWDYNAKQLDCDGQGSSVLRCRGLRAVSKPVTVSSGSAEGEVMVNVGTLYVEHYHNVIWSDLSASNHRYPTLQAARLPRVTEGGSGDFFNERFLDLSQMGQQALIYRDPAPEIEGGEEGGEEPAEVAGNLQVSLVGSLNEQNEIYYSEGETYGLLAYELSAEGEDFMIEKLTIVNDVVGDFDQPEVGNAIAFKNVGFIFENDSPRTFPNMETGEVTFAGLGLVVPAGESRTLSIVTEISDPGIVSGNFLGQPLRLGIRNAGNTEASFQAVGMNSGTVISDAISVEGTDQIQPFSVVLPEATIATVGSETELLSPGLIKLMTFNASNETGTTVGVKQMEYNVNAILPNGERLTNFRFAQGSRFLGDQEVSIVGSTIEGTGQQNLFESSDNFADLDGDGDGSFLGKIVVTLTDESLIAEGISQDYSLYADVVEVEGQALTLGTVRTDLIEVDGKTGAYLPKVYGTE